MNLRLSEQRLLGVPKDARIAFAIPQLGVEIYYYEQSKQFMAIGFSGRSGRCRFHRAFSASDKREDYVATFLSALAEVHAQKLVLMK